MVLDDIPRIMKRAPMRVFLSALVLGSILIGAPCFSHAADDARLLLVDSAKSGLSPELGSRVRSAIVQAANSLGVGVIRGSAAAVCGSQACVIDAGKTAEATHVVWIEASFRNESYTLNLEVWDVEANREVGSDAQECAICANQDLLDAALKRGRAVLERSLRNTAVGEVPAKTATSTSTSTSMPTPTPVAPPATRSGWASPKLWAGAGLTLAGIGAGITGIYYITQDGARVAGDPFSVRDTMMPGVALGVAGATAFVCGVTLLTWHWLDSTTVAVGPGRVMVAGRF